MLKIFVVYFIVFGTYGIFMWAMFKPFQVIGKTGKYTTTDKVNTRFTLFHTLFWRLLNPGNDDHEPVSITRSEGDKVSVSYEFSHAVTMFVWAVYQITIVIVLVNLLIAMMTNTFGMIQY